MSGKARRKAEKMLSRSPKSPKVKGTLRVDGSWSGGEDLDIVVVTPSGRAVSYQGGGSRMRVQDAGRTGYEKLALRARRSGRYQVFVARKSTSEGQVRGTLRIKAHRRSRTIDFDLPAGERIAKVADVRVRRGKRVMWR